MQYFSTNKISPLAGFKEATIRGLAPDKGLYFPEHIPLLDESFIRDIEQYSNAEIAEIVIRPYVSDDIPANELKRIVEETVNFNIPLVKVNEQMYSLELFHGPTLAFKDIGARFMSRCLGYFARETNRKVTVLVATSGDTGGAVADGFYDVDGVDVVILYPSGKVSNVQEKQLTTLGKNIHALEVEGDFDDCQRMVKQVFADETLNERFFLTSANSINVARWLPQQFYYFFAWKQWADKSHPPVIAVPSGNFGNICAGMLANRSGLPVKHFIAACNANDTVPEFLLTGTYNPKKAVATISNAMDVSDPSNFVRIMELYGHDTAKLKERLSSYCITDAETKSTIQRVLQQYQYLLDPHGAVACNALEAYLHDGNEKGIFLETAHPVKFYDVVEPVTGKPVPVPLPVQEQMKRTKNATKIAAGASNLISYLEDTF